MADVLYGMSSPNVLKIVILLEELERPFRFEHVDLFQTGGADAALLALNPNGKVPVLVRDDGETVIESGAILLDLAEESGRFLPADRSARREALQWLILQVSTVGPLLGQLNHFTSFAPAGQDYALGRYRREGRRIYGLLDARLADREYLAAGEYTIADMATLPWTDYVAKQGLNPDDYPNLMRWRAALEERPAVQRARAMIADVQNRDGALFQKASPEALLRFSGQK